MNSPKKKILHIITGLDNGGAEAIMFRFVTYDKSNIHYVVSLRDYGKYGNLLILNNINVHILNISSFYNFFQSIYKLISIIKDIKPDIVQTWMYHADLFGGVISKISNVKKIFWGIHNSTITNSTKLSTRIIIKINSLLSKYVPNKIISCSNRAITIHKSLGFSVNKFFCIHNGYSSKDFYPDILLRQNFRQTYEFSNDIFILGMIARYDNQKDPLNFFKAISIIKKQTKIKFKCILVGSGMDINNKELVNILQSFSLIDDFILFGQSNDINTILNGIDLNILSSRYGEAFPNVIAEAMLSETPCIATNVGDVETLISDTGWIIEPNNSEQLANQIILCFEEYSNNFLKWKERSTNARKRIKDNFTIELMVNNYNKIWKS
jgi:glycosyltransferase involved in cell wall biosynthesis